MEYKNISTVEVAELLKLKKGTGNNYHCFNAEAHNNGDKNPSLSIKPAGFFCHACGIKGNNIELIKQFKGIDTSQAFKWIEENFGSSFRQKGYPISELSMNNEKRQIRLIQEGKKRFIQKYKRDLKLKEPTLNDIRNIKNWLGKSFRLETLLKAGIMINHRSGSYGMVFKSGPLEYNPRGLTDFIHMEGRTDWLTAIEIGLDKHFGLISDYNKTSKISINKGNHYFICDKDVNQKDILSRISTSIDCKVKYIKLPGMYNDLSDFYNQTNCKLKDVLKIIESIPSENIYNSKKGQPEFVFEMKSAADLQILDIKAPEYVIPDFLTKTGTLLLSGSPKIGKTNLFTYLGIALAEGWPAFGNISIQKKFKVLFLALEDSDSRMKRKIEAIYSSESGKTNWSSNFIYILDFPNKREGGLESLRQLIENCNPDIIAIDTLEKFIARGGNESYSGDYSVATEVQKFTQEFDKAFIFLHHNRKAGGNNEVDLISGSYGISGSFDNFWIMQREAGQIILSTGGRDILPEKYQLKYNIEYNTWQIEGKHFEIAKSKEQDQVLNVLKNADEPLSISEFCAISGNTYNTAKTKLWRMCENKLIMKDNKGKYYLPRSNVTCNQQSISP